MRRLYDALMHTTKPYHHVRLSYGCQLDLLWWSHLLEGWKGKALLLQSQVTAADDISIETDASGSIGYGALYGPEWFAFCWPRHLTARCITFKELYPICVACATWGHKWSRMRICFHSDNTAVVAVVASGTSKCPKVMALLRQIFFICAKGNFMITARHIPGVTNVRADALSRQELLRFSNLHPTANRNPSDPRRLPSLPGETASAPCASS